MVFLLCGLVQVRFRRRQPDATGLSFWRGCFAIQSDNIRERSMRSQWGVHPISSASGDVGWTALREVGKLGRMHASARR
jgi:hypothetical protein